METSKCKGTSGDLGSEKNYFSCISCKVSYKSSKDLLKHNRQSHKRRDFYCTNCGKSFIHESSLKNHVTNCNRNKQFSCSVCGQMFSSMKKLDEHDKKHTINDVICDVCCETFKSEEDLNKHTEIHEGRHYIECDFCETICFNEFVLQQHLATHKEENQDVPKNTSKERDKPWKYKRDTREKLLQCPACRKKFSFMYNLNLHLRVCSKASLNYLKADKEQLKQSKESLQIDEHTKQSMESSKDKQPIQQIFRCTSCRKKFCTQNKLKYHKRICIKSKYKCPKCKKGYASDKGLSSHRCSLKNDVYKCNVCDLAFNFKEDLFKHFFVHKSLQGIDLFI